MLVVVLYEHPETAARTAAEGRLRVEHIRGFVNRYVPAGDRLPHARLESRVQGMFRS